MRHLLYALVLVLGGMLWIAQEARAAEDAPPAEAMWTVNCQSFNGPFAVEMANRKRDAVKKLTGWKDWFVLYHEAEATLYFGYFKASPDRDLMGGDPKDVEKAREGLKKVRSLRDTENNPVFPFAFACEIPRPGAEGPSDWDIRNTPADRYWSLIIGEYRDNPERKKAAVQAVEILRKDKTEAYYLHGPTSSLVLVGAWPRKAIKEQEADKAAPDDPNTIVKVYNFPLPKNAVTEYYDTDGKHYKIYAPKVDVQDPRMRAAIDANPYFHTNGQVLGKRGKDAKGKEKWIPDPSQLMIIPRKGTPSAIGGEQQTAEQTAPGTPRPPVGAVPGTVKPKAEPGGKLKSLD